MSIKFLLPIQPTGYTRTFTAEIDVLAANEVLVRGEMRDHRFACAHTWQLRTPDYEVIAASAEQRAGDTAQFNPDLCARYAGITGVRMGRGFSKRVVETLGDLPGAKEHLLMAIEMARVGQQVYQYAPEFEAQFPQPSGSSSEAAHVAWLKDRAYMNLANSCYAYRDESETLFASRAVRCGFDASLTRPQPGDRRVFWRNKQLTVTRQHDEVGATIFACTSAMADSIHDIKISFDLSSDGVIANAQSRGLRLPYHGICEDPHLRTPGLNGLRVTAEFVKQLGAHVGGAQGCTHLFDLALDCLRLFQWADE